MVPAARVATLLIVWLGIGIRVADAQHSSFEISPAHFEGMAAPCLFAHNQGRDLIAEYIDTQGEVVFRAGSWLGRDGRYLLPAPDDEVATVRFRTLEASGVAPADVTIDACPEDLPIEGIAALSEAIDARLSGYLGEAADTGQVDEDFQTAIASFEQNEHPHWLAVTHYEYGAFARSTDQLSGAEEQYRSARNLFQSINDSAGEAATLNTLGLVALRDGRLNEAASFFNEALVLFSAIEDFHHVAAVNNNLGLLAMRTARLDDAASHLDFALTLLQGPVDLRSTNPDLDAEIPHHGAANLTWALNTLNNLAIVRMRQGAADLAERYWRNYLAATHRVDRALGAAQARHSLGTLMLRQGRLGEALDLLAPALQQFARLDARRWLAEARIQLSILYFRLGDSELALDHASQAVDLASEDLVARMKAARNLAHVQHETGAPEDALATLDRTLNELGDSDDKLELWRTQSQRGDVALQLGRTEEAIKAQLGVLEQLDDDQDVAFAARVRYRLARARMQNDEPGAATPCSSRRCRYSGKPKTSTTKCWRLKHWPKFMQGTQRDSSAIASAPSSVRSSFEPSR